MERLYIYGRLYWLWKGYIDARLYWLWKVYINRRLYWIKVSYFTINDIKTVKLLGDLLDRNLLYYKRDLWDIFIC